MGVSFVGYVVGFWCGNGKIKREKGYFEWGVQILETQSP